MEDKLINALLTVLEKKAGIVDKTVGVAKKVAKKGKKFGELLTGQTVAKAKGTAKKVAKKEINDLSKLPSKAAKVRKSGDIVRKAEKAQGNARIGVGVGAVGTGAAFAAGKSSPKQEKEASERLANAIIEVIEKRAYGMNIEDELEDIPYQTDEKYKLQRVLDTLKSKAGEKQVGMGPVGAAAGLGGLAGAGVGAATGGPGGRMLGAGIGGAAGAGLGGLLGLGARKRQGQDIEQAKDLTEVLSDKDNLRRFLGLYLKNREVGKTPGEPWARAGGSLEDQQTTKV